MAVLEPNDWQTTLRLNSLAPPRAAPPSARSTAGLDAAGCEVAKSLRSGQRREGRGGGIITTLSKLFGFYPGEGGGGGGGAGGWGAG